MYQRKTLVLGTLGQGLNADYDPVLVLANQHARIRQMLGHGDWTGETRIGKCTVGQVRPATTINAKYSH